MDKPNISTAFVFSKEFDPEYIRSIYEDDFRYLEEIFQTVLDHYPADAGEIHQAFEASDEPSLRKAVHKMKPAFGFLGMIAMQEKCDQLEKACDGSGMTSQLKEHAREFTGELSRCRQLIQEEHARLKSFNQITP